MLEANQDIESVPLLTEKQEEEVEGDDLEMGTEIETEIAAPD